MALALFVLLLLYKVKLAGRGDFSVDSFNVDDTRALKGVFTVAVILHHLCPSLQGTLSSLTVFENVGFLAVGGFFFISGYGLMYGAKHKKGYLKGFLFKRLSVVLIPHYLVIPFYILASYVSGSLVRDYIILCLSGVVIWYAAAITVMYLCFFVSVKLFGLKWGKLSLAVLTALYALAMILLYENGLIYFGSWWYNSIICFPLGVLYCDLKGPIDSFVKRFYYPLVAVTAAVWVLSFFLSSKCADASHVLTPAAESLCAAAFCAVTVLLSMKLRVGNRLLWLFGELSFEMYLTHALWMELLTLIFNRLCYPNNVITSYPMSQLLLLAILAFSAVSSYVIHKVSRYLHGLLCGLGKKKEIIKNEDNRT